MAEILSKSLSPVPVLTATLCEITRRERVYCLSINRTIDKLPEKKGLHNNKHSRYLYTFGMLGRKLHPVVDRVMLVNRGEESELVEETTDCGSQNVTCG